MSHPILIARDLCLGYENRPNIIQGLSLEVSRDDVVGIIGSNGCGKTTLVKAILGLIRPLSGSVQFFTEDGQTNPHPEIGYVPQQAKLDHQFPILVQDIVASGLVSHDNLRPRNKQRIQQTLERLSILHLANRPVGMLSGGERQKVLLARALVSHPPLLIMDEPTTYVDEDFSKQLFELIPLLQKESALIIVSHDTVQIKALATKIIQL